MIEPKEVTIDNRVFYLSKFPAVAGREIVTQYPVTATPKIGDYKANEAIMLKLMQYVGVKTENGQTLMLNTQALVDNHTGSWETLGKLELAMMEYNCSFFADGRFSSFFEGIAQTLRSWVSKTLTNSSEPSFQTEKPPSTN